MTAPLEPLYTVGEVAEMYRVEPKTILRWIASEKLHAWRTPGGRAWRIPESSIPEDVRPA